ncbi:Carotenoid cleavage dioxygenase 8, chloroplastic [Stylosanthes scabra]|uniref:Carotenoid cleavage dioxygenase 8, chloroplastic n=1 Tax=Stylosanthes scabra TaxID=79078 RepID=A0ABU6TC30_9FABA|nr:Carotenoid cleavage dioxygenase 8, chloroplastic [Stylosanthes scabra]
MAFSVLPSSPSISWPRRMIVSNNMSDNINKNVKEGFVSSPNKGIYKSQRSLQDLTVANVASSRSTTPLPALPPQPLAEGHQQHGAWTSICQERWEGELVVQGEIPLWLKGTYLRNGPGIWHVGDYNVRHLFDGYATLVKLHFEDGRLISGHRQLESQAYQAAKKNQKICYHNANTGVVRLGDGRVCAHPIVTEEEFLILLPDLLKPGYLVVRMVKGSNERKVIGRVNCRGGPSPGWVHSFPVTQNYVVVPEMPLRYCAQNLLKAEPTPLYKFQWHPQSKAYMHVMCKTTGNVVASVEVPPYVAFHFINAYEERDEDGRVTAVIADCCEHYANTDILEKLILNNLRSFNGEDVLPDARVGRFRIPLDGSPYGTLEAALDPNEHGRGMDMCSINPNYLGKKYRYAYACGAHRPCNFPNAITKIDLELKKAKSWYAEDTVPSEPFFVPRSGATEEDYGVVISIISEKNGGAYALVLDGSTFEEIARAKFPYTIP